MANAKASKDKAAIAQRLEAGLSSRAAALGACIRSCAQSGQIDSDAIGLLLDLGEGLTKAAPEPDRARLHFASSLARELLMPAPGVMALRAQPSISAGSRIEALAADPKALASLALLFGKAMLFGAQSESESQFLFANTRNDAEYQKSVTAFPLQHLLRLDHPALQTLRSLALPTLAQEALGIACRHSWPIQEIQQLVKGVSQASPKSQQSASALAALCLGAQNLSWCQRLAPLDRMPVPGILPEQLRCNWLDGGMNPGFHERRALPEAATPFNEQDAKSMSERIQALRALFPRWVGSQAQPLLDASFVSHGLHPKANLSDHKNGLGSPTPINPSIGEIQWHLAQHCPTGPSLRALVERMDRLLPLDKHAMAAVNRELEAAQALLLKRIMAREGELPLSPNEPPFMVWALDRAPRFAPAAIRLLAQRLDEGIQNGFGQQVEWMKVASGVSQSLPNSLLSLALANPEMQQRSIRAIARCVQDGFDLSAQASPKSKSLSERAKGLKKSPGLWASIEAACLQVQIGPMASTPRLTRSL